ncbi:hypothetical protein C7M84_017131 [Penaeus vannamei]|uniref:Uncharacterized protein n=1 Tax=Penaeus vannamei TaxID=6689 RepID=A0A3R7LWD2_PENVA|nr:hypothetical protein C7M84_017131 [Penaeus vannamei]
MLPFSQSTSCIRLQRVIALVDGRKLSHFGLSEVGISLLLLPISLLRILSSSLIENLLSDTLSLSFSPPLSSLLCSLYSLSLILSLSLSLFSLVILFSLLSFSSRRLLVIALSLSCLAPATPRLMPDQDLSLSSLVYPPSSYFGSLYSISLSLFFCHLLAAQFAFVFFSFSHLFNSAQMLFFFYLSHLPMCHRASRAHYFYLSLFSLSQTTTIRSGLRPSSHSPEYNLCERSVSVTLFWSLFSSNTHTSSVFPLSSLSLISLSSTLSLVLSSLSLFSALSLLLSSLSRLLSSLSSSSSLSLSLISSSLPLPLLSLVLFFSSLSLLTLSLFLTSLSSPILNLSTSLCSSSLYSSLSLSLSLSLVCSTLYTRSLSHLALSLSPACSSLSLSLLSSLYSTLSLSSLPCVQSLSLSLLSRLSSLLGSLISLHIVRAISSSFSLSPSST